MAEEKTKFPFSFFDAAHTEGYIATSATKRDTDREGNQLTLDRGFFADDEKDEDIVAKIHHWQQDSSKMKTPKSTMLRDLFSELPERESARPESDDKVPTETDNIHLNRLLDDYMLGSKGDRIMQQMEDLTADDPPSAVASASYKPDQNKSLFVELESSDEKGIAPLADMVSMEDFEKYIAEN